MSSGSEIVKIPKKEQLISFMKLWKSKKYQLIKDKWIENTAGYIAEHIDKNITSETVLFPLLTSLGLTLLKEELAKEENILNN